MSKQQSRIPACIGCRHHGQYSPPSRGRDGMTEPGGFYCAARREFIPDGQEPLSCNRFTPTWRSERVPLHRSRFSDEEYGTAYVPVDDEVAEGMQCRRCGHHGLVYHGWRSPDGSYIAEAVCPKCGHSETF